MITTITHPACSDWLFDLGAVTMSLEAYDALRYGDPITHETETAEIGAVWKRNHGDGYYLFILDFNRIARRFDIIIKD
jgi:hypothetical protein